MMLHIVITETEGKFAAAHIGLDGEAAQKALDKARSDSAVECVRYYNRVFATQTNYPKSETEFAKNEAKLLKDADKIAAAKAEAEAKAKIDDLKKQLAEAEKQIAAKE